MANTFRPPEHISRRAEFDATYQAGIKINRRWMTNFVRPNGAGHARLGIAATRKIGGAIIRNRAKRLARELFRTHRPAAAIDVVVVPRREFLDAPFTTLERDFESLLGRASRVPTGNGRPAPRQPRGARGARVDSRV